MLIVDSIGLSEILKIEPRTLRDLWREFPHFFVGRGRDLRSVRFDAKDVIQYLKERDYEPMVRQKKKALEGEVLVSKPTILQGDVQNKERRCQMGKGKKERTGKPASSGDPYNLSARSRNAVS